MRHIIDRDNRRGFLSTLTLGAAAFATRGVFADELVRTPKQTEGPFYPDKLPLDTDNDLLIINDTITPAVGEITLPDRPHSGRQGRSRCVMRWSKSGRSTTTDPTFTPRTASAANTTNISRASAGS